MNSVNNNVRERPHQLLFSTDFKSEQGRDDDGTTTIMVFQPFYTFGILPNLFDIPKHHEGLIRSFRCCPIELVHLYTVTCNLRNLLFGETIVVSQCHKNANIRATQGNSLLHCSGCDQHWQVRIPGQHLYRSFFNLILKQLMPEAPLSYNYFSTRMDNESGIVAATNLVVDGYNPCLKKSGCRMRLGLTLFPNMDTLSQHESGGSNCLYYPAEFMRYLACLKFKQFRSDHETQGERMFGSSRD